MKYLHNVTPGETYLRFERDGEKCFPLQVRMMDVRQNAAAGIRKKGLVGLDFFTNLIGESYRYVTPLINKVSNTISIHSLSKEICERNFKGAVCKFEKVYKP